jgi:hypothetical protein
MSARDVRHILSDPRFNRNCRLLRLQGQRGQGLEHAVRTGLAVRLGPAQCAFFGALALVMADVRIYVVLAAVSAVGVFTKHHPVEWLYSWWRVNRDRVALVPNRAARRFGCLLGAVCFLAAGVALSVDAPWLFWPNAVLLVALPAFVALTNVCVPSLVFTLMFGAERAARESLIGVSHRGERRINSTGPANPRH